MVASGAASHLLVVGVWLMIRSVAPVALNRALTPPAASIFVEGFTATG
jgi:hypothetical protein